MLLQYLTFEYLMCTMNFIYIISFSLPRDVDIAIISVLMMRKMKQNLAKWHSQGHIANEELEEKFDLLLSDSKPCS